MRRRIVTSAALVARCWDNTREVAPCALSLPPGRRPAAAALTRRPPRKWPCPLRPPPQPLPSARQRTRGMMRGMGPVIPGAPFSMSPDAAIWVVERLRAADAPSAMAGMVPALFCAFSSDDIPDPHFDIGWYCPEDLAAGDGTWVDIFDRRVFVHEATLEDVRGKHLALHRVDSRGSRLPMREARYVLRVGPEAKGIFQFLGG